MKGYDIIKRFARHGWQVLNINGREVLRKTF